MEVRYDQVTGCRFRHGTTFLRWRPDKAPRSCGMDQLARELNPAELDGVGDDFGQVGGEVQSEDAPPVRSIKR